MKTIALSIISAGACLAAIGNLRVLGTTATQALIGYTAPDANACTIQLSQSAGLTPLALDVDPGTFANSNFDLSRAGTVTQAGGPVWRPSGPWCTAMMLKVNSWRLTLMMQPPSSK